jgi:hypothetical protein
VTAGIVYLLGFLYSSSKLSFFIIYTFYIFIYNKVNSIALYLHAYELVFLCFNMFLLFLLYMLLFPDLCFCLLVFLDGILIGSFLLAEVRPPTLAIALANYKLCLANAATQ